MSENTIAIVRLIRDGNPVAVVALTAKDFGVVDDQDDQFYAFAACIGATPLFVDAGVYRQSDVLECIWSRPATISWADFDGTFPLPEDLPRRWFHQATDANLMHGSGEPGDWVKSAIRAAEDRRIEFAPRMPATEPDDSSERYSPRPDSSVNEHARILAQEIHDRLSEVQERGQVQSLKEAFLKLSDCIPLMRELMETATPDERDDLCREFPGLHKFAVCLEEFGREVQQARRRGMQLS